MEWVKATLVDLGLDEVIDNDIGKVVDAVMGVTGDSGDSEELVGAPTSRSARKRSVKKPVDGIESPKRVIVSILKQGSQKFVNPKYVTVFGGERWFPQWDKTAYMNKLPARVVVITADDKFVAFTNVEGTEVNGGTLKTAAPAYSNQSGAVLGELPTSWTAHTVYDILGTQVSADGDIYQLVRAGTSGASRPAGAGLNILDGTCLWNYVGEQGEEETAETVEPLDEGADAGSDLYLPEPHGGSLDLYDSARRGVPAVDAGDPEPYRELLDAPDGGGVPGGGGGGAPDGGVAPDGGGGGGGAPEGGGGAPAPDGGGGGAPDGGGAPTPDNTPDPPPPKDTKSEDTKAAEEQLAFDDKYNNFLDKREEYFESLEGVWKAMAARDAAYDAWEPRVWVPEKPGANVAPPDRLNPVKIKSGGWRIDNPVPVDPQYEAAIAAAWKSSNVPRDAMRKAWNILTAAYGIPGVDFEVESVGWQAEIDEALGFKLTDVPVNVKPIKLAPSLVQRAKGLHKQAVQVHANTVTLQKGIKAANKPMSSSTKATAVNLRGQRNVLRKQRAALRAELRKLAQQSMVAPKAAPKSDKSTQVSPRPTTFAPRDTSTQVSPRTAPPPRRDTSTQVSPRTPPPPRRDTSTQVSPHTTPPPSRSRRDTSGQVARGGGDGREFISGDDSLNYLHGTDVLIGYHRKDDA